MTYIHIPVVWEQPELHQLVQFFDILKIFESNKVWVHCAKNMRASTFIYLYRKLCLMESEDISLYPMKEVWEPNETWQAFIHKVMNIYSLKAA
jgi:protein tyrosine phosphatase (PTP) superfamily phosphohydrolase (DUF442 family)